MKDELAIKVENVSKNFILPHERIGSVKGIFTSMFSKATKKKETLNALKNISFEIKKGEFFGIVGRNGSGKSTLLKMLAGIYQPTKGKIVTTGKLVPFIELGVGFNQELTGRDNVYLNGAVLGFSTKEVDAMYDEIVSFAELERFMDQKLKNYSSGMQVRLAFSMAVRSEAEILLIDEVLAVGDADFQRKCFDYFKKLKRNHKTVIFVSHDMSAVREYCDRAMLIDDSVLIYEGKPDNVATRYAKLFMKEESDQVIDSAGNRWGDGAIITDKIDVNVSDDFIAITQYIKALKSASNPVVGIRIKDIAGNHILGTNTKIENVKLGEIKRNQIVKLNWEIPNILSDGTYIVDPAILHEDGITVADWWDDAEQFILKKKRHLPYPIDPGFKVFLET